jgi:UDP-galactose 4-epimerase (EC 5.1.3.2)
MKALVCGGAGYIGSHMCKALHRAGHEVIVLDRLSTGHREAITGFQLEEVDLLDAAEVDRVVGTTYPDVVFHFAALSIVSDSTRDPAGYLRNNVDGTAHLVQSMSRHGIGRLVFSSTAAVYGMPAVQLIDETQPLSPINPYGESKLQAERLLHEASATQGLRSVSLRYFNAAGADPLGGIGEAHDPETHLIPNAIRAADGLGTLRLFGDDYATPDGTCIRDYVHVNDLARAHLLAAEYIEARPGAFSFNLGSGKGCSVREIVDAVARITKRAVPHEVVPRRAGDPERLVADVTLARNELGWVPELSDVDTLIATAHQWHRHRHY